MDKVKLAIEKLGGPLKGICHMSLDVDLIKQCGVNARRTDIPYPLDENGNISAALKSYKEVSEKYMNLGVRTVSVTPYPREFANRGIDVKTPEGLAKAREICRIAAEYLGKTTCCWQISNELYGSGFRAPLENNEQVSDYIIACQLGIKDGSEAITGNNSIPVDSPLFKKIEEGVGGSDYYGIDAYPGCFGGFDPPEHFKNLFESIHRQTDLPIILMEFGYVSKGGSFINREQEIKEWLNARGFKDQQDVRDRIEEYIDKVLSVESPQLVKWANSMPPKDRVGFASENFEHLMNRWNGPPPLPRTPEGQAEYYQRALKIIEETDYVAGCCLYSWNDASACYWCGKPDCLCETGWGILDKNHNPKPAYYVVKEYWNK